MATAIVKDATVHCLPCKRDEEIVQATLWCNICSEGLCKECSIHHARNKASTHHKILPLTDVHTELLLLNKLQTNLHCEHHPDNLVTVFCEDDDVFCCTVCISTSHKRCENVQSIDQAVRDYTPEIREADINDVNILESLVSKMIEEKETAKEEAEVQSRDLLTTVQNKIDTFIKELSRTRNILEEEIKRNEHEIFNFYDKILLAYHSFKKELNDLLQVLHADKKLSSTQTLLTRHMALHSTQKQAEEMLKALSDDIPEMKILLNDKININDFMFANISIVHKKAEKGEFPSQCEKVINRLYRHFSHKGIAQIAQELVPLISCGISFVDSIERSIIQACGFTPYATYLLDNTILLSDTDNEQLIKLDKNLSFRENLSVAGKPYGICVSSGGNKVYVVCNCNKVISYTLQSHWTEVNRFDTEEKAWGIACNDNRIVTGHDNLIVFYDHTGTKICKIDTSGESYYPVLSSDGKMLYHADGNDAVVCRSMDDYKQVVWRFSSQKLRRPRGLGIDQDGNILIVGLRSQNIHQVSGDGKLNRVIVDRMKYIEYPRGLFFNKNSNTFGVTSQSPSDTVCVELYRLVDSYEAKASQNTTIDK